MRAASGRSSHSVHQVSRTKPSTIPSPPALNRAARRSDRASVPYTFSSFRTRADADPRQASLRESGPNPILGQNGRETRFEGDRVVERFDVAAGPPSSSGHALVGGLVGAGIAKGGLDAIRWVRLDGLHP